MPEIKDAAHDILPYGTAMDGDALARRSKRVTFQVRDLLLTMLFGEPVPTLQTVCTRHPAPRLQPPHESRLPNRSSASDHHRPDNRVGRDMVITLLRSLGSNSTEQQPVPDFLHLYRQTVSLLTASDGELWRIVLLYKTITLSPTIWKYRVVSSSDAMPQACVYHTCARCLILYSEPDFSVIQNE